MDFLFFQGGMDFINPIDNIIEVRLSLSVENALLIQKKRKFRYF
jgi:hypothetical protein